MPWQSHRLDQGTEEEDPRTLCLLWYSRQNQEALLQFSGSTLHLCHQNYGKKILILLLYMHKTASNNTLKFFFRDLGLYSQAPLFSFSFYLFLWLLSFLIREDVKCLTTCQQNNRTHLIEKHKIVKDGVGNMYLLYLEYMNIKCKITVQPIINQRSLGKT